MNHLVVYSHFDSNSFSNNLKKKLIEEGNTLQEDVQIIDLYRDGFNPILAGDTVVTHIIKKYQNQLSWADHYSFIFPLWWGQMPAILKGFFDRVFTPGFAFTDWTDRAQGLLSQKTASLYISTGYSNSYYESNGIHDALRCILKKGVFGQCGIDAKVLFFGNVNENDQPIELKEN